jgi:putative restriction endonuclease
MRTSRSLRRNSSGIASATSAPRASSIASCSQNPRKRHQLCPEFENGRDYYALHGSPIRLPKKAADCPAAEALFWHNEERFLG